MADSKPLSLTLVGCGAMGGALLTGWLQDSNLFSSVTIVTPEKETADTFVEAHSTVTWLETPEKLESSDVIIFGVKPQLMDIVLPAYKNYVHQNTLVMSMAAGLNLSFYEKHLGEHSQLVRFMPNTPATVSKAMSGLVGNTNLTPENKDNATRILESVGEAVWVKTDDDLDRLTAISGCGPAYLFAFIEALEKAAKSLGIESKSATKLARETIIGSAQYLEKTPNKTATDLRIQVTSPGGMTAAGLAEFDKNNRLNTLVEEVAKGAYGRAAELKASKT